MAKCGDGTGMEQIPGKQALSSNDGKQPNQSSTSSSAGTGHKLESGGNRTSRK